MDPQFESTIPVDDDWFVDSLLITGDYNDDTNDTDDLLRSSSAADQLLSGKFSGFTGIADITSTTSDSTLLSQSRGNVTNAVRSLLVDPLDSLTPQFDLTLLKSTTQVQILIDAMTPSNSSSFALHSEQKEALGILFQVLEISNEEALQAFVASGGSTIIAFGVVDALYTENETQMIRALEVM